MHTLKIGWRLHLLSHLRVIGFGRDLRDDLSFQQPLERPHSLIIADFCVVRVSGRFELFSF